MEWGCIIEDASILTLTLTRPCREVAVISRGRRDSVSCVIWWGEKHNDIDLYQERKHDTEESETGVGTA